MNTADLEEEKRNIAELSHALMDIKSNQPTCKNCGNKFKPSVEEIQVDIPEEDNYKVKGTSFVEKPDYCSEKCRKAHKL